MQAPTQGPAGPYNPGSYPTSSSDPRSHARTASAGGYRSHPPPVIQLPDPTPIDQAFDGSNNAGKVCSHCRATQTPLWRRDPRTHKTLCNACGLYLYQRQSDRPPGLIAADSEQEVADSDGEYSGPECENCGTRKASTWRRDKAGAQVCNACGVYERTNGKPRPLALRNDKIKPRTKHH
jgi:Zn ribbon nucleic-acid-binding protein